jgi:hypothetical protein
MINSVPVSLGNYLISKNNLTSGGFTVGATITKDMTAANRPTIFNSLIIFPGTSAPPVQISQYWVDWQGDIFDSWGYFYLYEPKTNTYSSPILSPINQADGVITTQSITAFSRQFTIKHGYPVQGIFKYDISVDDDEEFQFGGFGNMGSDSLTSNENFTQSYSINNNDFILYYIRNRQTNSASELFYIYVIPYETQKNKETITYSKNIGGSDILSFYTVSVKKGVTIYFSKTNDVKDWVINDLTISSSY